jgi:hypothetical protein
MTLRGCAREKEVSELVERGQWPQASAPELRDHVCLCRACADLALVASALQAARAETIAAAQAGEPKRGSAGALWWRAQLRRRRAAVERMERPLVSAQIFALLMSLLAAVGFAGFEARHGVAWLNWLQGLPQEATTQLTDQIANLSFSGGTGSAWTWLLLAAAATLALVGGVIVYLISER